MKYNRYRVYNTYIEKEYKRVYKEYYKIKSLVSGLKKTSITGMVGVWWTKEVLSNDCGM